jgi:hypothetical protein
MPASELLEWMEYERVEPFGAWRDNWHTAILATLIANSNRKPNSPPVQMREFFYIDAESAEERRDEEMVAFMESQVK